MSHGERPAARRARRRWAGSWWTGGWSAGRWWAGGWAGRLGLAAVVVAVLSAGIAVLDPGPGRDGRGSAPASPPPSATPPATAPGPASRGTSSSAPATASTPASPGTATGVAPAVSTSVGGTTGTTGGRPPARSRRFGIAAGSTLPPLGAAELDRRLSGMAALGAGWVRLDLEWNNVAPTGPGTLRWVDYDPVVRAVVAHGLRPLLILDYTPPWARADGCTAGPVCRPRDAAEFAAFAGAAARRYAPMGVHHWEIWNEPNLAQFFAPAPDPGAYTALLRAATPAIHAADPGAVVVTGGLAPTDTAADGSTVAPPDFLRAVYAAGGRGAFDAVGHHPYTFPYTPGHAYPGGAWDQLSTLHAVMSAKGDGGLEIWATEYGAPTGGPGTAVRTDARRAYPGATHVSEALQATIATDALARWSRLSWAGPLLWYSYQDSGTSPTTTENFFGLLRADGSRKPAFDAYRSAVGG